MWNLSLSLSLLLISLLSLSRFEHCSYIVRNILVGWNIYLLVQFFYLTQNHNNNNNNNNVRFCFCFNVLTLTRYYFHLGLLTNKREIFYNCKPVHVWWIVFLPFSLSVSLSLSLSHLKFAYWSNEFRYANVTWCKKRYCSYR